MHTLLGSIVIGGEVWTGLTYGDGGLRLPDGAVVAELMPTNQFVADAPIHMYWAEGGQGCAWSDAGIDSKDKMLMLEWPHTTKNIEK